MVPHEPRLKVGDILSGRYRMIDLLGGGGMGFVYLAEDLRVHGRKRTVKEMKHSADADQFAEEARMLSRLSHPSLPQIIDTIQPEGEGYGYIVMDYIDGETLTSRFIRSGRRLPIHVVLSIAEQVCGIFVYLHEQLDTPVAYRDLKPNNLLIDAQDRVRLIDFGIARFLASGRSQDTQALGTPGFAAPEQYAGQSGPRSDLYNLGALLFYLLSGGKHPDVAERSESGILPGTPQELVRIVGRLLHADPDRRYGSAKEVLDALQQSAVLIDQAQAPAVNINLRKPMIVVGSLYHGAGATFICEALTRALARQGVRTTQSQWHGHNEPPANQSTDDLIVCDVGEGWHEHTDASDLAEWADLVVIVADPLPGGWRRTVTERKLRQAGNWREHGTHVHFVANRDVELKGREDWLRSFPWKPACIVPSIDFAWVVDSAWRGGRVQDHPLAAPLLDQALQPILREIQHFLRRNT